MALFLPKTSVEPKSIEPLSIRANMVWNSIGSFVYIFAQWFTTVLVVRISVGFEAAGIYTYAISLYSIFAAVAEYRMYAYQVSDLHDENSVGEYLAFRCITCALSIVLTMVYSMLTSKPELWLPVILYLLYKNSSLILDIFHAEEQKKKRMDYIGISLAIQGVGSAVVFWIVFGLTQNLNWTLLAMIVVVLIIGAFYDVAKVRYFASIRFAIDSKKAKRILIKCLPGVLSLVALAGAASVPRQYLLIVMGDSALGIYGTIAAPLAIIQTCASFIFNPLLSYFTEAYEEHDQKQFLKLTFLTLGGVAILGIASAIAFLLVGELLYSLIYGSEILGYMYLVPLLIVSSITMSLATFLNTLLVALRNFKATLIGGIVALVISVLSMVPFVHLFELNGVTLSLILATVFSSVIMGILVIRQLRQG